MSTQDLFALSQARSGRSYWIGVVSGDAAQHGQRDFGPYDHANVQPLRRMKAGDGFVHYSPGVAFRGKEPLQFFTAIGVLKERPSYLFDMGGGSVPHRRDIDWVEGREVPIRPWLDNLEFAEGSRNWSHKFRFGHLAISEHDFRVIAQAMHADPGTLFPGAPAFARQLAG